VPDAVAKRQPDGGAQVVSHAITVSAVCRLTVRGADG
jgi:hypothetical protein